MEDIVKQLNELKREIEKAKAERSELIGEERQYLQQLKEKFSVKNEKEAETKLKTLEKTVADMETKIKEGFQALEAKYEW